MSMVTPIRYSDEFDDKEGEVTYESSDGIRFRIRAIHLKAHTGILAPPEGSLTEEVVHLTENASILTLLFKFISPMIQPVLERETTFDVLKDLAEAAEKYQVFPAMYVCNLQMRATLPNHAIAILGYALKHDYPNLVNDAAPLALDATFPEILQELPPEFYTAWSLYHGKWLDVRHRALCLHLNRKKANNAMTSIPICKLSEILGYERTFAGQSPQWLAAIRADIEAVPRMSEVAGLRGGSQDPAGEPRSTDGLAIESSDDIYHYIEQDILRACATGFDNSNESKIRVPESSSTISLLLQFITPTRIPELVGLPFHELRDLAFAAEKYRIFPAMGICRLFMKKANPSNAREIFHYAVRTQYYDVLDWAAPFLLHPTRRFFEKIQDLPAEIVGPWASYFQKWQDISMIIMRESEAELAKVICWISESVELCDCQMSFSVVHRLPILDVLMENPGALLDLDKILPETQCLRAQQFYKGFRAMAERLMKEVPPLSSFI